MPSWLLILCRQLAEHR